MKNNRVFVLCDTTSKKWQLPCANAERHVESRAFAEAIKHDFDCMLSAVSPKRELFGKEDEKTKFKILKQSLKSCRYVYCVDGWQNDPVAVKLERAARWRFKTFIEEEED